jgi:S-adenosyl-L-methionine hydrolase (adenosine-forming)
MRAGGSIVFATDFGPASEWVGICHAVIARIAPQARVIDLTHSLRPFDVEGAGLILQAALSFAPVGVAVLVVDPGVGTERREIAVQCRRGDVLVGPDNGLLPAAAEGLGGIVAARALANEQLHLDAVSKTFHARDVFCPVAAHLANGVVFEDVGGSIDPVQLVAWRKPLLDVQRDRVRTEIIDVDGFGNVRLSAKYDALEKSGLAHTRALHVATPHGSVSVQIAETFGALAPGRFGLVIDSFGWLCLCLDRASAAERLRVARGDIIELINFE